jgi:hypothetical protein
MTSCNKTQKKLCSNECDICFNRSLASTKIAQYWVIQLNNNIKPRDVNKGTNEKFWFNCGAHIFQIAVSHIFYLHNWCPYPCCLKKNAKKLCVSNDCNVCYKASFASSDKAKFWYHQLNIDNNNKPIQPRNVFMSSDKKYWFNCGSHIFQNKLRIITSGSWCPYPCCCKISSKLCESGECKICFNASFASSEKANFWDVKLNNDKKPRDIAKFSTKEFWFYCGKHFFKIRLSNISSNRWCPYPCCCKSPKQLCDSDKCDICFKASFAVSDKSKFWCHELNNGIKPRDVFRSSAEKYWFKCDIKNHPVFKKSLCEIARENIQRQTWCPFLCCGKGHKLCDSQECKICFDASFASSDKVNFWHNKLNINDDKEIIKPRNVYKSTHDSFWFKCEKDHIFYITLNAIDRGSWCEKCSPYGYSKIAIKWLNTIMSRDNIFIQHAENEGEYFIKTKNFKASVDGYCPATNSVYEFHGDFWHGNPNVYNPEDINSITKTTYGDLYNKTIDREKNIKALGYNLVSIWEKDYKDEIKNNAIKN